MWSDRVVFIAPLFNGDLGFLQAVEDFLEALVTQFAVEGLAIAAVLGAAGPQTTFAVISEPLPDRMCS
jgi:hypothetical protein